MPAFSYKDVRRLDVSVRDAFNVCRLQRIGNFNSQLQQDIHLQRPPGNPLPQRLPLQILHGNERSALVLANLVNRADVRMIQRRSRPRFPAETFQCQRVTRRFLGQKFQGHQTSERDVLGLVHHAHAARPELL